MRITAISLALAILAYTPTNAQIAAAQPAAAQGAGGLGAIGALVSDIGAIAGGLNGGGATVTVPVSCLVLWDVTSCDLPNHIKS